MEDRAHNNRRHAMPNSLTLILLQERQKGLQYLYQELKSEKCEGLKLSLSWRLESDHYVWVYIPVELKLCYAKQELKL